MSSRAFRLATFNVENLYSRPNFWDPQKFHEQQVGNVFFEDKTEATFARRFAEATLSDEKCQLTALALLAANADIVALQEVDSEGALRSFRENYLKRLEGPHVARAMRGVIFAEPRPSPDRVKQAREAAINARSALRRQGSPADVAGADLWLVRDAPFVTGQTLRVDGGRNLGA